MISTVSMMRLLAALPVSVLGAAVAGRDGGDFDVNDLTLREVGARNTMVSSSCTILKD